MTKEEREIIDGKDLPQFDSSYIYLVPPIGPWGSALILIVVLALVVYFIVPML